MVGACVECNTSLTGLQQKFCSNQCHDKWWSRKRRGLYNYCIICGNKITKGRRDRKQCSLACKKIYAVNRASCWYFENKNRKRKYDENRRKRKRHLYRAASKRHRQRHPGRKNADTAKRRALKLQRTPAWANLDQIKKIYESCPFGYHVDHIIPLQGKTVSGLHIETNLQYLKAKDNLKKSNHYSVIHRGMR